MDHYNLELLLLFCVELLAACYFLDKLLHDDSIVVVSLTGRHFNVVDGGEDDAGAGGGGGRADLEFFLLTFDLMYGVRVVECLEDSFGECPLA